MKPELYMRDLMKEITLNIRVKGVRRFRWRVFLGLHIMRMAAAVMGVGLCIEARRRIRE